MMKLVRVLVVFSLLSTTALAQPAQQSVSEAPPAQSVAIETVCDDRKDDDGDGLTDCADADCFEAGHCEAGGQLEQTQQLCSDWIDNDADGEIDCDDTDCQQADIPYCAGSADIQNRIAAEQDARQTMPEVKKGMNLEDLLGSGADNNGERNDYLCSDGVDNDADGRVDCADFGCRFDPEVSVCTKRPSISFSVVAAAGLVLDLSDLDDPNPDVRFTRIQMRAIGSIPTIDNSFFLFSFRLEKTPRLTFVNFQLPIAKTGHFFAVNSGGGTISSGPIVSIGKFPLLERPFYLYRAFEGGNGAALEVFGPILRNGVLNYRSFVAGGEGFFNGNVGGKFFRDERENFTWAAGAQIAYTPIGFYDRYDTLYLYTPVDRALSFRVGAKYEEREIERFPALNMQGIYRHGRFLLKLEGYGKYLYDFEAAQFSWNALTSILLVPKKFMFAADVGSFGSQDFEKLPTTGFDSLLRRPLDEFQWRVALHWYFFRNIGVLSAVYSDLFIERNPDRPQDARRERLFRLETQFRF